MANRKELVLEELPSGCIVPVSHKLNKDGYFRKQVWLNGELRPMMYHRYVWTIENGEIPQGYEVDHKCKNRACCNVEHLQLLTSSEHRSKDNKGRYSKQKEHALRLWKANPERTGTSISEEVGVTFSSVCRWIREWKHQRVETIPRGSRAVGETPTLPEAHSSSKEDDDIVRHS